jgi:hypothetical protein
MVIPKHSTFQLYTRNFKENLFDETNVNFLLEEDVTISARSEFKDLYPTPDNAIFDLMGMASVLGDKFVQDNPNATGWMQVLRGFAKGAQNVSGKYKEFGFQVYKSTAPLKLKLNLSLRATFDANKQVYLPSKQLMLLPLPTTKKEQDKYNTSSLNLYGQNKVKLQGGSNSNSDGQLFSPLIPPGPSVIAVLNENYQDDGRVFGCSIGNLFFDDVFIEGVDATFSQAKMLVGESFYPMSARLNVDISSMYLMTKGMIHNMNTDSRSSSQVLQQEQQRETNG